MQLEESAKDGKALLGMGREWEGKGRFYKERGRKGKLYKGNGKEGEVLQGKGREGEVLQGKGREGYQSVRDGWDEEICVSFR